MSKRLWIVVSIIGIFLLIAVCNRQVAALINVFLNLKGLQLDTLEKRVSIVGNSVSVSAMVIALLVWLIGQWRGKNEVSKSEETGIGNKAVFHGKVKIKGDFVQGNKSNHSGGDDV